jgi:hypothetical protein
VATRESRLTDTKLFLVQESRAGHLHPLRLQTFTEASQFSLVGQIISLLSAVELFLRLEVRTTPARSEGWNNYSRR